MRSSRWQAQGNVYLVTDEAADAGRRPFRGGRRRRHPRGLPRGRGLARDRDRNPDGSRAEMSGNGTRIAARWLAERTGADEVVGARRPARGRMPACSPGGLVEQNLGEIAIGEPEEVEGIRLTPSTSATRTRSSKAIRPSCRDRATARGARAVPATHERAGGAAHGERDRGTSLGARGGGDGVVRLERRRGRRRVRRQPASSRSRAGT